MPIGKVKWYDPEKGFGFVSNPGDDDCFVSRDVLPDGVEELQRGQKLDYDVATGKRGPQALRVRLVETPRLVRKPVHKYTPEQLHGMIGDVITLMESKIQPDLRAGRWPEKKTGGQIAEILRAVAKEIDG